MTTQYRFSIAALACSLCTCAFAQSVEVRDAWVRTSVPGQKATGAFMKITAKDGARLVSVSSPLAGVTEVHEMKMEGDVMKMRASRLAWNCPPARPWNSSPAVTTSC